MRVQQHTWQHTFVYGPQEGRIDKGHNGRTAFIGHVNNNDVIVVLLFLLATSAAGTDAHALAQDVCNAIAKRERD